MLTLPETIAAHEAAARKKVAMTKTPLVYLVQTMLAGAYIGIGVVIMTTAGGPLKAADSPWGPFVNGIVFGVALMIVIIAGGELATSAMMILTQGAMRKVITWVQALVTLLACMAGNLIGAFIFAWIVKMSGALGPDTAPGKMIAGMIVHKAEESTSELFFRGVLCNLLVCLAVWCAARLTSEGAKIAAIFACVAVFITSGFEHVVANMTTFSFGLLSGLPEATIGQFARNIGAVGLGNLVGGGLLVGAAYVVSNAGKTPADQH